MSRKESRADRLAREAARRVKAAERIAASTAQRVTQIVAVIRERHYADLRRELAEAAQRHRAQALLEAAMAVTDEFTWKPWGYELSDDRTVELPVIPALPQLRLIHGCKPIRARQQLALRARRELVAA